MRCRQPPVMGGQAFSAGAARANINAPTPGPSPATEPITIPPEPVRRVPVVLPHPATSTGSTLHLTVDTLDPLALQVLSASTEDRASAACLCLRPPCV